MRALKRNKTEFWYANPVSETQILDEYGNETTEVYTEYSEPQSVMANISPSRGNAELDMFGINTNYTKTIVTDNLDLPITADTILWIDTPPDDGGESGSVKHDYVVVQVAKSLNVLAIAVKEVKVS